MPGDDLQWIAQGLDLVLAGSIGEEVELEGAAGLRFGFAHAVIVALAGVVSVRRRGFLEVHLRLNDLRRPCRS